MLRDFMEYRLEQDEQHTLAYLTPELRQTIQYQDLLPASSPRWLTYTVTAAQQPDDNTVVVTVQIAEAAQPVGPEILGFMEQDINLERRNDRWLVTSLGPQKQLPKPKS